MRVRFLFVKIVSNRDLTCWLQQEGLCALGFSIPFCARWATPFDLKTAPALKQLSSI